jgi:hypothetical protein
MTLLQFALTHPLFTGVFILACIIWTVGTVKMLRKPPHYKDTNWKKR